MSKLFQPPAPPYFAVIFTSIQPETIDSEAYLVVANRMTELAEEQDGFLGMDHARSNVGITISYWKDEASIRKWKAHDEHQLAQTKGKESFYSQYVIQVCEVTRAYSF